MFLAVEFNRQVFGVTADGISGVKRAGGIDEKTGAREIRRAGRSRESLRRLWPTCSKTSLTSRLIEVVDGSCARARAASGEKSEREREPGHRRDEATGKDSGARLKSESGLITHWSTIENVARRRRGPVSVGAVIDIAQELRTQITRRDRRGKTPGRILNRRGHHRRLVLRGDIHRCRAPGKPSTK